MRRTLSPNPSRVLAAVAVVFGGLVGTAVTAGPAQAASQGPCDIYAAGGTPCVAAHSHDAGAVWRPITARCTRCGAPRTMPRSNIGVLSAGGYANAAAQDSFCAGTSCVITIIYDQSGRGNNLTHGARRRRTRRP